MLPLLLLLLPLLLLPLLLLPPFLLLLLLLRLRLLLLPLLRHLLLADQTLKSVPTMMFFHGNAGTISDRLPNAKGLYDACGCNVALVRMLKMPAYSFRK